MLRATLIALIAATALPATAQEVLDEYLWQARPIVLFANSPNDPRLVQQLDMLTQAERDLEERDVVIIVDTDDESDLRTEFRPRDFQFLLIGKDGQVQYRRPDPVPVRELVRVIDRMPLRRQEMGRN